MVVIMVTFAVTLTGCSGNNKDSAAKKPEMSDSKKAPPEMDKILKDTEKIITALGKKVDLVQKSKQQGTMGQLPTGSKKSGSAQEQSDKQSKSKSEQSESDQNQAREKKQSEQASLNYKQMLNDWQAEQTSLINIHRSWNALEPEAVKAGLDMTERNSFEQILDDLTLGISQQNLNSSLRSAIALYGQYAQLTKIFEMPIPPDFHETKYQVMAAAADAAYNDWDLAVGRVTDIKEAWNRFKLQAKLKDEKLLNKTEFAIEDLIRALENQRMDLLVIKTTIALNNLQEIEKNLQSSRVGSQQ